MLKAQREVLQKLGNAGLIIRRSLLPLFGLSHHPCRTMGHVFVKAGLAPMLQGDYAKLTSSQTSRRHCEPVTPLSYEYPSPLLQSAQTIPKLSPATPYSYPIPLQEKVEERYKAKLQSTLKANQFSKLNFNKNKTGSDQIRSMCWQQNLESRLENYCSWDISTTIEQLLLIKN